MDLKEMKTLEERCIQEQAPPCVSNCPVHVDVREMISQIKDNKPEKAYELFRQRVLFPKIIASLCDSPCESFCNRKNFGGAIAINGLEKYCLETLEKSGSSIINQGITKPLRIHNKRVAIIGAGTTGLAAAHTLYEKGYIVSVFDKEIQAGGSLLRLPAKQLHPSVIEDEFKRFSGTGIEFRFSETFSCNDIIELVKKYNAVIISFTPDEAYRDLYKTGNSIDSIKTYETIYPGVFSLPSAKRENPKHSLIQKVSEGKGLAISAERFLKNVSMTSGREMEGPYATQLYTNLLNRETLPRNEDGDIREEAFRCFQCSCLECVKECVYLRKFESYPKRYIREISNNLSIVFGIKTAKNLINSCSLCGLCERLCPSDINMGEVCQSARETMWNKGSMPPATHDFPIKDMIFSNGPRAVLSKNQPGTESSDYIFFPGCQLSGMAPDHVVSAYKYLISNINGRVGILLGCCGAPAKWAGRQDLFLETLSELNKRREVLGKGIIITACSSCKKLLLEKLPSNEVVSLWEIMDQSILPSPIPPKDLRLPGDVSILDPCTSRDDIAAQGAVRNLLIKLGINTAEMHSYGEQTKCCGFGGLTVYASPDIASEMVEERLKESTLPLVAYCSVCRESFAGRGREVWHLLDLLFSSSCEGKGPCFNPALKGPGISSRQDNRIRLKKELLQHFWGENMETENEKREFNLLIDPEVNDVLEKRLILQSDLYLVIEQAEKTGKKIFLSDKQRYAAHLKPGIITYWVEYSPEGNDFRIHNAYSHRLSIEE